MVRSQATHGRAGFTTSRPRDAVSGTPALWWVLFEALHAVAVRSGRTPQVFVHMAEQLLRGKFQR